MLIANGALHLVLGLLLLTRGINTEKAPGPYAAEVRLKAETGFAQNFSDTNSEIKRALNLIQNEDPLIRKRGVEKLASLPASPLILGELVKILKNERDFGIQYLAAKGLKQFGAAAQPAIPELINLTAKGGSISWPPFAAKPGPPFLTPFDLLHAVGRPAAVDLIRLLKDTDKFRRYHAARTLSDILTGRDPDPQERLLLLPQLVPAEDGAVPVLMRALKDRDDDVCLEAVKVLHFLDKANQSTALVLGRIALKGKKGIARAAVEELRKMGSKASAAVDEISKALRDNDVASRLAAVDVLRELGPVARGAKPALIKSLSDSNDLVRKKAAEALKALEK